MYIGFITILPPVHIKIEPGVQSIIHLFDSKDVVLRHSLMSIPSTSIPCSASIPRFPSHPGLLHSVPLSSKQSPCFVQSLQKLASEERIF